MVIQEDAQKQEELEALLLQFWAQGYADTQTVEEVFGPYESWLLPLGTHLLLLHPVLKEWLYLDRLHQTWEHTGFGPREVVFFVRGTVLGARRREGAAGASPVAAEQRRTILAGGEPPVSPPAGAEETMVCPTCGARARPGSRFCAQCGAALKPPRPATVVQSQVFCPVCFHRNAPGKKFCAQCGAALKAPRSATAVQSQVLVCPVCHHRNAPGARFCARCGARSS